MVCWSTTQCAARVWFNQRKEILFYPPNIRVNVKCTRYMTVGGNKQEIEFSDLIHSNHHTNLNSTWMYVYVHVEKQDYFLLNLQLKDSTSLDVFEVV